MSNMLEVAISQIQVGERYRKDLGDLQALANSIAELGLLQPIGIDANYKLVFGERRLRASQRLGHDTILARIVNLDAIVLGEYAENEVRKDFTQSERVAIAKAVELALGNRQGQRTDRELPQNFAEVKGKETRDIAAKKAGFGNRETYRQAKKVVDKGTPELIDAMDKGEVAPSEAAKIASKPQEEQNRVVKLPTGKEARRIAIETGKWVEARDGKVYMPKTEERERWEVMIGDRISLLEDALENLAKLSRDGIKPERFISDLERYQKRYQSDFLERPINHCYAEALIWLDEFRTLWESRNHETRKLVSSH